MKETLIGLCGTSGLRHGGVPSAGTRSRRGKVGAAYAVERNAARHDIEMPGSGTTNVPDANQIGLYK